MRLITAARQRPRSLPRPIVTIGTFDGVHRAHQAIIRHIVRTARRHHGTSIIISFDPHPRHVLHPGQHPRLLTDLPQRLACFRALEVDHVWLVRFTRRFAQCSPEVFFQRLLIRALHAHTVVIGPSFGFGQGRRGDAALLAALGRQWGVRIAQVPAVQYGGLPISSSRIRAAIAAGHLRDAAAMLGRRVTLVGRVVRGAGRGRSLGFPTANLDYQPMVTPPHGVYLVRAQVGARWYPALANVGRRPTFHDTVATTVEVHLLRRHAPSLYGRRLVIEWRGKLRDERAFASAQHLRRQIAADVASARQYFRRRPA